MTQPLVSVIVPIHNEIRAIDACLDALLRQTYPHERLEILVIDGRSTDGTRERLGVWAAQDGRIRVLDNPSRLTARGLNLGIQASRGDVIVRVDARAVVARDYVERAVQLLYKTGAACVGGPMVRARGKTIMERAIARATSSPVAVGDAVHNYATAARQVETVYLGTWPRQIFERVGLFDPELVRNQDDELSYRIRSAGGSIWLDPSISVVYTPRSSLRRLFSQYRQYGMWKVRVFQMHPAAARMRHLIPAGFVATIAVLVGASRWLPEARFALASILPTYLLALARGATKGRRPGDPLIATMAAIATVHAAYGIGFWVGLVRFSPRWFIRRHGRPDRLAT